MAFALALLGPGLRPGAAQESMEPHPAHIHSGSCDQLGDVVYPLTDVSMTGMMTGMMAGMAGTPESGMAGMATPEMGQMMGAANAEPVETSYTVVDTSLDDLLGEAYAINVHESAQNIGNYIACGNIGGMPMTMPGMEQQGPILVIGLRELNGSGHSGVAVLMGQGDKTAVIVFLTHGLSGGAMATPAAG
jgi:hypothetical protein